MLQALRRSVGRRVEKEEDVIEENLFEPDFHKILICRNDKDNTPESFSTGTAPYNAAFYISQSRSPGHKDQGQDAMATACHGDWECNVLCDGHDRDGHLVARAVCSTLPRVVLRRITEHESSPYVREPISEALLIDAFEECANAIAWTAEGVKTGMFVKVFGGGKWDGKVGYVGDSRDRTSSVVIIVDANGYHRPTIANKMLRRAKYMGGSTCVCMIRNLKTGESRIAQTGDSRVLLMNMEPWDDPIMFPVPGLGGKSVPEKSTGMGFSTPAHNVFSTAELLRLNTHHAGAFEIDGAFLVNPITKFAIQPTRGFGDFDMFGTGYTNEPEVSASFILEEGSFVFCASDGVFDEHVWKDDELVSFFAQYLRTSSKVPVPDAEMIADMVYHETLERSLAGGYVDDISLFCFTAASPTQKAPFLDLDSSTDSMSDFQKSTSIDGDDHSGSTKLRKKSKTKTKPRSKSLLGNLTWGKAKRSNKGIRAKSLIFNDVEIDEDLLVTPDVDAPTPEDRRTTIQRKDKGSFTELSNVLLQVMKDKDEEQDEGEDIASVVLKRYASLYDLDPEEINIARGVHHDAADEGKRRSARYNSDSS